MKGTICCFFPKYEYNSHLLMIQSANYMADRANPPQLIYLEDDPEWYEAYGFPRKAQIGLGLETSWYQSADDILLLFAKEERLSEAREFISEKKQTGGEGKIEKISEDDKRTLAGFIDPQRLKDKVLVLDNEVYGWLYGSSLIEAIVDATQTLNEHEKPKIVSLMCSSPNKIENDNPSVWEKWQKADVEVIHKLHNSYVLFWMG